MDPELEQPAALPDSEAAGNSAAEDENLVVDGQQNDVDADAVSQEEAAEEDDEIEVDGKKFAMPKSVVAKLNAERMMNAAFTQKTQAVAEERKAVAAEREQVVRQQQEAQQYIGELAKVQSIDDRIAEYKALDWDHLSDTDPQTFQKLDRQMRALEASRNEVMQSITQKQEQNRLTEQQATAKQVQEAEAYLAREIPGITPERLASIEQYAATRGIDKQQFSRGLINSPVIAVVLDKARMFDELQQKQSTKPKTPTAPPAPVTRVGAARASARVDPAKMSDAQWFENRNKTRKS